MTTGMATHQRCDAAAAAGVNSQVLSSASVTGDEQLAYQLQMEEDRQYEELVAARRLQYKNDQRLARLLSDADDQLKTQGKNSGGRWKEQPTVHLELLGHYSGGVTSEPPDNVAISLDDSELDFSDSFDDASVEELTRKLELAQQEAEHDAELESAADAARHDAEMVELLPDWSADSDSEYNDTSSDLIVTDSSDAADVSAYIPNGDIFNDDGQPLTVPVPSGSRTDWPNRRIASTDSPVQSNSFVIDIAVNILGSALSWVSSFFSPSRPTNANDRCNETADEEQEEDDDDEEEDEEVEMGDGDDEYSVEIDSEDEAEDEHLEFAIATSGYDMANAGLMRHEIEVLPTRKFVSRPSISERTGGSSGDPSDQNECQVCLGTFAEGEILRTLPCCHHFHCTCIDRWLQANAACPICRVRIRDEIDF